MKFDVYIDGVRLESWSEAAITLDATNGASAEFVIPSAGAGPWLSNLQKVKITGRNVRTETASYPFEDPAELDAWSLTAGLEDGGIDYTESAFGSGAWLVTWTDPATMPGRIYQAIEARNMHGLVFWGWFALRLLTPFAPHVQVTAYAADDAGGLWQAPAVLLTPDANWRAVGLRIAPTYSDENFPTRITEWGFQVAFAEAVPPAQLAQALFELHLDSVALCGRAYPATLVAPPFATAAPPAGSLAPYPEHACATWDDFAWADALAIAAPDAGWCAASAVWDEFPWASELNPTAEDMQWN
jgi:hypothetical protein